MLPSAKMSPTDGRITVDADERKLFKQRRVELGLTQRELALRAHTTNGTISNLEKGKHPQIKRSLYMRLRFILLRDKAEPSARIDEMYKELSEVATDLDEKHMAHLLETARSLKKLQ